MAVPMANYLIKTLQVSEFRNTNIIGDADKWTEGVDHYGLRLIPTVNVGLIGDYGNIDGIGMAENKNLWNAVSRETAVMDSLSFPQRVPAANS
jgi:hypothetical protein